MFECFGRASVSDMFGRHAANEDTRSISQPSALAFHNWFCVSCLLSLAKLFFKMQARIEQRANVKLCVRLGLSQIQIHRKLTAAYKWTRCTVQDTDPDVVPSLPGQSR